MHIRCIFLKIIARRVLPFLPPVVNVDGAAISSYPPWLFFPAVTGPSPCYPSSTRRRSSFVDVAAAAQGPMQEELMWPLSSCTAALSSLAA